MMLLLPFLLQWSLSGFGQSSAVALWALMAPLGALVFLDLRRALPWFMAFVALVAISGLIDARLTEADVPGWIVIAFLVMNVLGVSTTVHLLLQYFMRARERILAELEEKQLALQAEQEKSERLLLNIIPVPIAARLKESPESDRGRLCGRDRAVRRHRRLHPTRRSSVSRGSRGLAQSVVDPPAIAAVGCRSRHGLMVVQ